MTDTSGAPACPEWARQWRPQTKDAAAAFALYDDDTIARIIDPLPGFAPGADQDALAGLIRQWASQHLAIRRGATLDTASIGRKKLNNVAARLRAAKAVLEELPDRTLVAGVADGDSLRDLARNLDSALSMPRMVGECAALAERAAQALEAQVGRGRPRGDELRVASRELCWIYEIVTGRLPSRRSDPYGERCDGGPFEKFAVAALKRLWPKCGRAGRSVRNAVEWYRNHRSNAQ